MGSLDIVLTMVSILVIIGVIMYYFTSDNNNKEHKHLT